MTAQWYVLYSKSMKEALLWEQLNLHQIESYYPCLRVQPVNPRAGKVQPYFPRYIFGYLDLEHFIHSMLKWMPGMPGIVSFGGIPSQNPRQSDRRHPAARGSNCVNELRAGTVVMVQEGQFEGYDAIFDVHLSGEDRVRIFLQLLSRQQIRLELPRRQIQCKKQ